MIDRLTAIRGYFVTQEHGAVGTLLRNDSNLYHWCLEVATIPQTSLRRVVSHALSLHPQCYGCRVLRVGISVAADLVSRRRGGWCVPVAVLDGYGVGA